MFDFAGSQLSTELPAQVPSRLKHTLPFSYKLLTGSRRVEEGGERARRREGGGEGEKKGAVHGFVRACQSARGRGGRGGRGAGRQGGREAAKKGDSCGVAALVRVRLLGASVHLRVEAIAVGVVINTRGEIWVFRRQLDVEEEKAVGVGGVLGPFDHRLQQVAPVLEHDHVDVGR